MKTKLFLLLSAVIYAVSVSGQTLSEISAQINRKCPERNSFVTLDKTSFSANTFTLYLTYDDGYVNFDAASKRLELWKESIMMGVAQAHRLSPYFINRMIEKKVNYKVCSKEKISGKSMVLVLSPQDIKNALRKYGSLSLNMQVLAQKVAATNLNEGVQIDEYTTQGEAEVHDDCVELNYIIDDSFIDIDKILNAIDTRSKSEFKASIITSSREQLAPFLTALKNTGRSLKYTYTGKNTGKSTSIVLNKDDINDLMIR